MIFERRGVIMPHGEACHHIETCPKPLGDTGLMIAADPETLQPYSFEAGDVSRELAIRYDALDPSVSNPEWMAERAQTTTGQSPRDAVESPPPMRSEHSLESEGREEYRTVRAQWYLRHTGERLDGPDGQRSLQEQNELWNDVTRNFRERSDR